MAAIQDIQNLIARAQPIPLDLQRAALLEAQQQGLDNQALASVFGVPVSMVSAAYEATGVTPAPAVDTAAQQAEAQRISDLYGNVSGADGFDQSEVDFVTQLIDSKQVDVEQVARDFGIPTDVVQSVYDTETQRQAEAEAEAQRQPEEDEGSVLEDIFSGISEANKYGNIAVSIGDLFDTSGSVGAYNPSTGTYESPYVLNVAGEDTAQETKSASAGSEAATTLGQNVAKKVLDPDSVSIGDIGTNIFNVVTGPDSDSSDKTKAFFAITDALNSVIPGIGIAARLIDALDLFGGGRPEATPMTPEERAEYEATTRAELAALGFQEGGEGASEVLLDAILQSAGTNVTTEDLAGILGSAGITADDVGPLYTDQGTAADRGLVETLGLLKAFPAAVDVNFDKDIEETAAGGGAASSSAASSSAASSDSSAASSDSAADAAAAAGVTGGESITWDDLFGYLIDTPKELTDEEIAAIQAAAAQKALEDEHGDLVARQIYEAAVAETDPALKAKLGREYYQYRGLPIPTEIAAEIERLEAEAKVIADAEAKARATGDPQPTVFTTDTSGLSDDAKNVTLTPGQDITIVDTSNGTPAVDGDTKILTKEEKDAAFNEVLAGVDENTAIADVVAAAVNIYGETADAVVAVVDAANSAGVSAEDLSKATGISIEDINKAAEDANVAITNQETAAASGTGDGDNEEGDGEGDDATGCPAGSGKIDDGAGNCVCPEGFSENDSGVCEKDTDILDVINIITGAVTGNGDDDDKDLTEIVTGGGCTGGKIDDGFGNCVCPEGEVEIDGVCQAAGSGGGCTGGKIDDGFGNCVCPEGEVEIDGVCQAVGGGGGCTGGKIDDGFGNCVCPEGEVEIDGVCQAAGSGGGCTGGKIDDGFGNCVCPEGEVEIDGVCQAVGSGGGCTGGKIDDGFGNCVCPEGEVEIDGVCQAAGSGGGCTGGKIDDGFGNCICPEGEVEIDGVCQAAGGQGACTGGRTRDPITDECVCPSDKPNFNAATQQCEGVGPGTGPGECLGGKTRDPVTQQCVCPQGTEDVNGQCVGTGSGECPEGQTRDIFGNCVAPEPETTQAVPNLFRTVQTKPGEKVGALDFYDISGPSIFRSGAKTEEEEDPLAYLYSNYADGGIVQDYDIEELIRFLESQRG
jgi:hypothetical protein